MFYEHRVYSPAWGRWLNRDPLGEHGGENILGFLRNRPHSKVDILGLQERYDLMEELYGRLPDPGPDHTGAVVVQGPWEMFWYLFNGDLGANVAISDNLASRVKDRALPDKKILYKLVTGAKCESRGTYSFVYRDKNFFLDDGGVVTMGGW